jgi:hypothetical protein
MLAVRMGERRKCRNSTPTATVTTVNAEMPARVDRYLSFREEWPRVTAAVRESASLRDALLKQMSGSR